MAVWDTQSGTLLSKPRTYFGKPDDFALSPNGKWVMVASGDLEIYDPSSPTGGFGMTIPGGTDEMQIGHIVTATFGPESDSFLFATREGMLGIKKWNGFSAENPKALLDFGIIKFGQAPLGVSISQTPDEMVASADGKWLVTRTGSLIQVRDLISGSLQVVSEKEQDGDGVPQMAVSPSNRMIAISNSTGIKTLALPGLEQIAVISSTPATAITFSPDGCLLAWSEPGIIHITSTNH